MARRGAGTEERAGAQGRQAEDGRPSLQRRFIEDLLWGRLGATRPIGKKVCYPPLVDRERRAAKWPKIEGRRQGKRPAPVIWQVKRSR